MQVLAETCAIKFLNPGSRSGMRGQELHPGDRDSAERPWGLAAERHRVNQPTRSIVTDSSTTSLCGLSCVLRATLEILSTTSCPSTTSPKMVCLPVSHDVGATVMKNWQPLVLGPELAIASLPGLSKL